MRAHPTGEPIMQSYPLKPSLHCPIFSCFLLFPLVPSFHYFHVLSFLQALVCGFQHNSHPFSDCFLYFTHVMGTLVQFTLLLCYICFYMFLGGVGTNSLPSFHRGKIAPGGGRGSRGPPKRKFLIVRQDCLITLVFWASHPSQLRTQPILNPRVSCQ